MSATPPPYPPNAPYGGDWRYQRRMLREQAKAQRAMIRAEREAYKARLWGMQRRSLVGPILLIFLGIVFLLAQTGRLDAHHLWDWYGHWWPLLFVAIGIALLVEWIIDRSLHLDGDVPFRRRSLGGGVVALLILLAIGGFVVSGMQTGARSFFAHTFSINSDNIDEFLGDKHESDQSLVQAFPAGAALNVTNARGDVTVSGTSDDGQIHIDEHKEIYTRTDSEAAAKAQQLNPRITDTSSVVAVNIASLEGGRADLTITVPPTAFITINANHGDVKLASTKAGATILANHGDVEASAITGPLTAHVNHGGSSFSAHSIGGPVTLEGHASDVTVSEISGPLSISGEFFGTTHLEHISRPVRFHTSRTDLQLARLDGQLDISPDADLSASEAAGPLVLTTRNREITLDRISGDVSVTNKNGKVDLASAPPLGNIAIENRNGSVDVTLPEHAGFVVQAQTRDGDLEDDFNLSPQDTDSHKSLNGTVGNGGPLIRIDTSQGDIHLRRSSISPLAPPAPPSPPISIHDSDGSSVVIGKDGAHIVGNDGSSVIVDKNGVRITDSGGTRRSSHRASPTNPPPDQTPPKNTPDQ